MRGGAFGRGGADAELVRRMLGRDAAAWGEFVSDYGGVVSKAVRRVFEGNGGGAVREEVEDAAAEVLVRLLKNSCRLLRQFDPERACLSTWLWRVGESTAKNALKRRGPATVSLEDVAEPADPGPPAGVGLESGGIRFPDRVLTARQERVLRLLYEESLTPGEVARRLGTSVKSVYSLKSRGIRNLREAILASERG